MLFTTAAAALMPDMAETVGDAETDMVTAALPVVPLIDGVAVAWTPMSRVLLSMTQEGVEEEEEEEEVLAGGGAVAAAAAA